MGARTNRLAPFSTDLRTFGGLVLVHILYYYISLSDIRVRLFI